MTNNRHVHYQEMRVFRDYPRLLLLGVSIAAAYILYLWGWFDPFASLTNGGGYVALFIAGILFSFGFTAAFGFAIFVELAHVTNPFFGAVAGGLGALTADLTIFQLMRFEFFHEELHRLKGTRFLQRVRSILYHERFPERLRSYILWSFAGIVIASPLPDEIGVVLVSSLAEINQRTFALFCFFLNTAGILLILLATRL
ncbi:hypothetical protein A3A67_03710 [Candidatus Peribacteria bacterium RIFCSPLOWO2_01_FULL_51_18]|nr:MAG: hypothetical protein A3A67_03710 [Candidatus Peribacteria bacterium RIFCSPLOWO2_01_FULL_51_18]